MKLSETKNGNIKLTLSKHEALTLDDLLANIDLAAIKFLCQDYDVICNLHCTLKESRSLLCV